jgi:hypothetical protein
MQALDKDVFDHITKGNTRTASNVKSKNDALKADADVRKDNKLGNYYDTMGAAATDRASKPSRGAPVQMIDASGNAVLMQPVQGADGNITYEPVTLPQGMRFPKQMDPAAIERRAAALEGTPMPGLGAGGKPQVYNADTAYSAARSQLYGPDAQRGPNHPEYPAPDVNPAPDKGMATANSGWKTPPQRPITTLPQGARTGADLARQLNPGAPLTDEELFIKSMGGNR